MNNSTMPLHNTSQHKKKSIGLRRGICISLVLIFLIYIAATMHTMTIMLVIAATTSYILNYPVSLLVSYLNFSRTAAVSAVSVIFWVGISLITASSLPSLDTALYFLDRLSTNDPSKVIQDIIYSINNQLSLIENSEKENQNYNKIVGWIAENLSNLYTDFITSIKNSIINITEYMIFVIITPVFTYFIMKDKDKMISTWKKYTGNSNEKSFYKSIILIKRRLGSYIRIQMISSLIIATLLYIPLLIIGAHSAFLFAFIAGILNLIPFIGPVIGSLMISIVAGASAGSLDLEFFDFANTLTFLGISAIIYLGVGYGLVPALLRGSANLHPIMSILIILIGGHAAGILGMLIALPVGIIAQIGLKTMWEEEPTETQVFHEKNAETLMARPDDQPSQL